MLNRILLTAFFLSAVSLDAKRVEKPDAQRYLEHVKYLASPELQGRGAGTEGLDKAAKYIQGNFKKLGLKPAGTDGAYLQPFAVTKGAKPGENNLLSVNGGAPHKLQIRQDYMPLSFSSNGKLEAPLVFAGYGITADEFGYDDYANLDVKDKFVVVLRYEPDSFRKKAEGKAKAYTHHSHLISKAINARNHGAKGVVLVNGKGGEKSDDLVRFGGVAGPDDAGILMVHIKNSVAADWFEQAGKSLSGVQKEIDAEPSPVSFEFPEGLKLTMQVDFIREKATVRNVLGYLPGKTSEYIVVGAHYDHLGFGGEGSLAPSRTGEVHYGADDNASGTAGLIELARHFAGRRNELKRGILFAAFAGEEIGLLGSAHWANNPTLPLKNATAMLNMDMIGRVAGSKLYIGGTGTGSTFDPMLKKITGKYDFKIDYSANGYSSSDHTSFAAKHIPVLFFFSGLHSDYHKPSDTWNKIEEEAAVQVVHLVSDVAGDLTAADERPQFVEVKSAGGHGGTAPSGGGYGPYFGSIPDFAPIENGVKFSDVRPGSPAANAGLKGGDILTEFAGKPIKNLYDFTFALRSSKVGDVVEVKYLRDGKEQTAKVTLEARK